MISSKQFLVATLVAATVSGTALAKKAPSSEWDPKATAEVQSLAVKMFADLDALDSDAFTAILAPDASVFDTDLENKPVAKSGADAMAYAASLTKELKDQGATLHTTIVHNDCHATAVLGFCAVEFTQAVTMKGEMSPAMKLRGTMIARKVNGTWKVEHWHGSLGEQPAPEAAEEKEAPAPEGEAPSMPDPEE